MSPTRRIRFALHWTSLLASIVALPAMAPADAAQIDSPSSSSGNIVTIDTENGLIVTFRRAGIDSDTAVEDAAPWTLP